MLQLNIGRDSGFGPQNIRISVLYGLTVWVSCNKTYINRLEKVHARAGRIIYRLPWDMSAENVIERTGWVQLSNMYKIRLTQCV